MFFLKRGGLYKGWDQRIPLKRERGGFHHSLGRGRSSSASNCQGVFQIDIFSEETPKGAQFQKGNALSLERFLSELEKGGRWPEKVRL